MPVLDPVKRKRAIELGLNPDEIELADDVSSTEEQQNPTTAPTSELVQLGPKKVELKPGQVGWDAKGLLTPDEGTLGRIKRSAIHGAPGAVAGLTAMGKLAPLGLRAAMAIKNPVLSPIVGLGIPAAGAFAVGAGTTAGLDALHLKLAELGVMDKQEAYDYINQLQKDRQEGIISSLAGDAAPNFLGMGVSKVPFQVAGQGLKKIFNPALGNVSQNEVGALANVAGGAVIPPALETGRSVVQEGKLPDPRDLLALGVMGGLINQPHKFGTKTFGFTPTLPDATTAFTQARKAGGDPVFADVEPAKTTATSPKIKLAPGQTEIDLGTELGVPSRGDPLRNKQLDLAAKAAQERADKEAKLQRTAQGDIKAIQKANEETARQKLRMTRLQAQLEAKAAKSAAEDMEAKSQAWEMKANLATAKPAADMGGVILAPDLTTTGQKTLPFRDEPSSLIPNIKPAGPESEPFLATKPEQPVKPYEDMLPGIKMKSVAEQVAENKVREDILAQEAAAKKAAAEAVKTPEAAAKRLETIKQADEQAAIPPVKSAEQLAAELKAKTAAEVPKGAKYQEDAPFAQEQRAARSKYPITQRIFNWVTEKLADSRYVRVESDGSLVNPQTGNPVNGVSFVRDAIIKPALMKLNPSKMQDDTPAHEMFHIFFKDLLEGPSNIGRKLALKAQEVVSKSPEFAAWKAGRKAGQDVSPEEFLTENVGLDFLRRASKEGASRETFKDFWSFVKTKFGTAGVKDYARLLSGRLVYDRPFMENYPKEFQAALAKVAQETGGGEKHGEEVQRTEGEEVVSETIPFRSLKEGETLKAPDRFQEEETPPIGDKEYRHAWDKWEEYAALIGHNLTKRTLTFEESMRLGKNAIEAMAKGDPITQKILDILVQRNIITAANSLRFRDDAIAYYNTLRESNLGKRLPSVKKAPEARMQEGDSVNARVIKNVRNAYSDIREEVLKRIEDIKGERDPALQFLLDEAPIPLRTLGHADLVEAGRSLGVSEKLLKQLEFKGDELRSLSHGHEAWEIEMESNTPYARMQEGESGDTQRQFSELRRTVDESKPAEPKEEQLSLPLEGTPAKFADMKRAAEGAEVDEQGNVKYQEDNPEYAGRRAFFPFLTSRFDKVAKAFADDPKLAPVALKATEQLHKYQGERDILEGRFSAPAIQAIQDASLGESSMKRIMRYLYTKDNNETPKFTLSRSEQSLADKLTKEWRVPRVEQNKEGLHVKAKGDYRLGGMKPEGYYPNMIDQDILNTLINKPGSAEAASYRKMWIDHALKFDKSLNKESAAELLSTYLHALDNARTGTVEFGALRRAEGIGLPFELTEKNLVRLITRYARRAAKDLAFFKHIQSQQDMIKFFGLNDQYGGKSTVSDDVIPPGASASEAVKEARRSMFDELSPVNPKIAALTRLGGNIVMGPLTAGKNLVNIAAFVPPYLKVRQLPMMLKALTKMRESAFNAYRNNAVRTDFSAFDVMDYNSNTNPFIAGMDRTSAFLRKWSGRDLSNKWEGLYAYTLGEMLAHDNIASAKLGDADSKAFLKKFGDLVEGGVERLFKKGEKVSADDLERIAKRFAERIRGTYSAEGLPGFSMEGVVAPWIALQRFSVEKANVIFNDVFKPMANGDLRPFLKYTLGSLLVGQAISMLQEAYSGRKGQDPTWKEGLAEKNSKALAQRLAATLQFATYAGAVGDWGKYGLGIATKGGAGVKAQQPLSLPALTLLTDTLGGNIADAARALREGEDPMLVIPKLLTVIGSQSMQQGRLANRILNPEEVKRKEDFRDIRVYEEMTGLKEPAEYSRTDEFHNLTYKKFKRETDLAKAREMLPEVLDTAIRKSTKDGKVDITLLKRELRNIRSMPFRTMPSPDTMPATFVQYFRHLEKTQGEEAARERLTDYLMQRALNQAKFPRAAD